MQLHQPDILTHVAKIGASIVVFSFAPFERFKTWVPFFYENILKPEFEEKGLAVPEQANLFERTFFLSDQPLTAYHAYGMGQSRMRDVYSPQTLRQYARWRKEGKPVQLPAEDPLQKGGDFVVNPQQLITLAQVGRTQHERPPVSQILEALLKS